MKKFISVAAVLALLASFNFVYATEAQNPEAPQAEMVAPKEFVSETMPVEVSDPLNFAFMIGAGGRKNAKVFDKDTNKYGLAYMVSMLLGEFDMLVILEPQKDEKGQIVPDAYVIKEVVAVKFIDMQLAWYKSDAVKKLYEEATK